MKTLPLSIIVILFVAGAGNAFAQSNNTSISSSSIPDDHLIFPSTSLTSNLNAESEKAIKEFVESYAANPQNHNWGMDEHVKSMIVDHNFNVVANMRYAGIYAFMSDVQYQKAHNTYNPTIQEAKLYDYLIKKFPNPVTPANVTSDMIKQVVQSWKNNANYGNVPIDLFYEEPAFWATTAGNADCLHHKICTPEEAKRGFDLAAIADKQQKQAHADNTNSISIQNLKVQPSTVKIGDIFNITATLVNNSQNPLIMDANPPCVNTVILDSHVTFDTKMATGCYDVFIKHTIDPGENFTMSYPDYGENFRAASAGTTNVTVPLSYYEDNQTVHSKTISKSIQFLIHDRTLQEELDLARIQTEKHQQEEQQTKNISGAIILAEVGIPIAAGVSVGVLLFARKRK